MGTLQCFPTIFTQGNKFNDFLFSNLNIEMLPNWCVLVLLFQREAFFNEFWPQCMNPFSKTSSQHEKSQKKKESTHQNLSAKFENNVPWSCIILRIQRLEGKSISVLPAASRSGTCCFSSVVVVGCGGGVDFGCVFAFSAILWQQADRRDSTFWGHSC